MRTPGALSMSESTVLHNEDEEKGGIGPLREQASSHCATGPICTEFVAHTHSLAAPCNAQAPSFIKKAPVIVYGRISGRPGPRVAGIIRDELR
jgi:hypothetical protein